MKLPNLVICKLGISYQASVVKDKNNKNIFQIRKMEHYVCPTHVFLFAF